MTAQDANLPFSQFVEFAVNPGHHAGLVAALDERFEQLICTYPGFIRASVHVSEDRKRVLSHVLWKDRTACERAFENAERDDEDMWGLIRAHRTRSMVFNAYEQVSETLGR